MAQSPAVNSMGSRGITPVTIVDELGEPGGSIPVSWGPAPLPVTPTGGEAGTVAAAATTAVNSAATSATLLAANANRRKVLITNTDANALYVKYGATASATSFAVAIPANGYWEMPGPIYTGVIDGIWAADGSGAAIITEM